MGAGTAFKRGPEVDVILVAVLLDVNVESVRGRLEIGVYGSGP